MDVVGSELISEWGVYLLSALGSIDTDAIVPFLKTTNNGDGLAFEGQDAFLHGFGVIVSPSAGLGSFGHAVDESLGRTVEVDEVSHNDLIRESLFKDVPIFLVSGESIKQVSAVAVSWNAIFNQLHHQVRRDQFTLLDVAIYRVRQLSALLLLLPQKITSREVLELVIPDQVFSLSSLTASGATEQEEDVRLWEHSETFVFLNGEGSTCEVLQPIVKNLFGTDMTKI